MIEGDLCLILKWSARALMFFIFLFAVFINKDKIMIALKLKRKKETNKHGLCNVGLFQIKTQRFYGLAGIEIQYKIMNIIKIIELDDGFVVSEPQPKNHILLGEYNERGKFELTDRGALCLKEQH